MSGSVIIEAPELQTRGPRLVSGVLTLVLWATWCYLWLPVVRLVAWLVGSEEEYQTFVVRGWASLAELALPYAAVITVLGGSLVLWATYNTVRFRGVDRRGPRPPMEREEVAIDYGVSAAELTVWQEARYLVIGHDESGHIAAVTTAPPSPPGA